MFVHTLSGAASFAACLRLFWSYPLAVTPCHPGGRHRSMVLRCRTAEGTGCHVLAQDPDEHFTLRPWDDSDAESQEIRPGGLVSAGSHQVITEGMPVPRDGALLGWVSDRQVAALLSVYHGQPGERARGPQVRVLAMAGSEPLRWPPFAAGPLDDGRLWEYVARGELVDLAPLVTRSAQCAFWVPSQNTGRARQGHGCVVVSRNLQSEEYWVPAGTYMDHWILREGVPAPTSAHLLTLPGITDLSAGAPGQLV